MSLLELGAKLIDEKNNAEISEYEKFISGTQDFVNSIGKHPLISFTTATTSYYSCGRMLFIVIKDDLLNESMVGDADKIYLRYVGIWFDSKFKPFRMHFSNCRDSQIYDKKLLAVMLVTRIQEIEKKQGKSNE